MGPGAGEGRRADELAEVAEAVGHALKDTHHAREVGLAACRRVIQAASRSIRAVHRREFEGAERLADEAEAALREAQDALRPHPAIAFAGFVHDAAKEYVEARLTAALVRGTPLPGPAQLDVEVPAWLNGLAEAASELRRHLLDRLRDGELDVAERLLAEMDDVYSTLVTIDFPEAMTGGLRRTTDALRAVLERTRSDLTLTVVQTRVLRALEADERPS